jgi:tRNA threonylcarbamoyladenosine biosynthesis protein TsaE
LTLTTRTPAETRALARRIAKVLRPGDVLGLVGDLGSGKTVFVQGLAAGLGIGKEARVRSPTFTVANVYEGGRLFLYHLDLYRLVDLSSLLGLGYEEYVYGEGVCAIEWLDRIPQAAPRDYLEVRFAIGEGNDREVTIEAHGARSEKILQAFAAESQAKGKRQT